MIYCAKLSYNGANGGIPRLYKTGCGLQDIFEIRTEDHKLDLVIIRAIK